jgi:hypothetical protein
VAFPSSLTFPSASFLAFEVAYPSFHAYALVLGSVPCSCIYIKIFSIKTNQRIDFIFLKKNIDDFLLYSFGCTYTMLATYPATYTS